MSLYANARKEREEERFILYSSVEFLDQAKHQDLKLRETKQKCFARHLHFVPLTFEEFPLACQFYPVVFLQRDGAMWPVAVTSLAQGHNMFVDGEGHWRTGCYQPAFVRRYPFVWLRDADPDTGEDRFGLAVDGQSRLLSLEDGVPLFENGTFSAIADKALVFARKYHLAADKTRRICAYLSGFDFFKSHELTVTNLHGAPVALTGFYGIDEEKLAQHSDEGFLVLRKMGLLPSIYAHILSQGRWSFLEEAGAE